MPGVFPSSDQRPNATYLLQIRHLVDKLWTNGIYTIIDLHQDVLSPLVCGEGTPQWMLNMSDLGSLPLPEPLVWHKEKDACKLPRQGWFKFLGWSEWYLTDAVGKAFQQLYHGGNLMSHMFDKYWAVVSSYFKDVEGVLAYELLNEPWIGDYIKHPRLLLEGQLAERMNVGVYMQRSHGIVRQNDARTPVLYSPAELNNRIFRHVGYEDGFLPGEPMAFHVYCLLGTDGPGPVTGLEKDICRFDDNFTLSTRESDLKRLHTAGFVTEFGATNDVTTGLAEVNRVANYMDQMSPPISWAFWDYGLNQEADYEKVVARSYATAVPGLLLTQEFNAESGYFKATFLFEGGPAGGDAELFLSKRFYYPAGRELEVATARQFKVEDLPNGMVHISFGALAKAVEGPEIVTIQCSNKI
eukprot:g7820.t1